MDNELVTNYLAARAARDAAQAELDIHAARLIKQMEADQRKSYRWKENGMSRAVTYVRKSTPVIDERGLRKALSAKVYDRYTVRKLDRKKMENAIDMGAVDKVTVSRFVSMKPNKPYLEFRERDIEYDDKGEAE